MCWLTSWRLTRKLTERTYTTKHGTTAVMNTANIGKTDRPALAPAKAAVPVPAPRPESRYRPLSQPDCSSAA